MAVGAKKKKAVNDELDFERKQIANRPGSLPYIWKRIKKNPAAMASLIFICLLVILSLLSPIICPSYSAVDPLNRCQGPSLQHLFGTDDVGRDILSRVLYGARYTLSIGILSTAMAFAVGAILGALSGYFGGIVDTAIMRFLDVFQAFPQILLAIVLAAVFGSGFDKIIYALGISQAPKFARLMRAQILTIRSSEYIEAAASINCNTGRIILHHVMPNAISSSLVQISMGIAKAGLSAASLSFLGFGVQPPTPEWGAMLSDARTFMRDYPHMVIFPGLFIMLSVLAFNLIGDALRDALDPKLRD